MDKAALISALQTELRKHEWNSFVDDPPSIGESGRGVVFPGCPCKRKLHTMSHFMDHLVLEAVPRAVESVFKTTSF